MKKKIVSSILAIVLIIICFQAVVFAYDYNYANSTHLFPYLYFNGYVQIKPSYNDGGYHALCGYLRYQIKDGDGTIIKDSGRQYIPYGLSFYDSRILSKSYTFWDSLNPDAEPTRFYYGFTWIPHGGSWPA